LRRRGWRRRVSHYDHELDRDDYHYHDDNDCHSPV
jgi:hypothetical protein